MDWFQSLFSTTGSVAHIVLLFSLVIAVGVVLGKIKIGSVSLGVTFVLFAGIVVGHIYHQLTLPTLTEDMPVRLTCFRLSRTLV